MNKEKLKVPKLRFKEFSGEWEEKELEEVSDNIMYGMNAAATEFNGKEKYLRITDISEDNNKYKPNPICSPLGVIDEKFKLNENDIVFTRAGASTGKSYLYNVNDGNLYFAGFLIRFSIKNECNSKFVFYNTLTNRYKKWVVLMSARSGQPGINAEEYKSFVIICPSLPEQQKIADFLSALDKKIDIVHRELGQVKAFKRGLLQQMFV